MMKKNFKILAWLLFSASVLLGLVANFFVQDGRTRTLLLELSFTLVGAGFLQMVFFKMNPKWFRDKTNSED